MSQPDATHGLEQAEPGQQSKHVSRRTVLETGAVAAGVLGLGGTATASGSDSPGESNQQPETLIQQLNAVYHATRGYRSVGAAREDGYARAMVVPNVGHVFAINDRIGDGELDITNPEALIYVDTRTTGCKTDPTDADLDLAAIEYVVPGDRSANTPDLFADETTSHPLEVTEAEGWHHNEKVGVTGLHVWLHHWNLAGLFNLTNPAVSAESSLEGRTDQ